MQAILPDCAKCAGHDDVIKWKHFPHYWPFVRGIHRSPMDTPHKGQWRGAFMFSLICARINGWVNNGKSGDLRRHRAHYDVTVMFSESVRRHLLAKRHKIAQIISTNNTSAILRNSGSIQWFHKVVCYMEICYAYESIIWIGFTRNVIQIWIFIHNWS